jgi:L-threonylcarbamoyladenylate synthase
LKADLEGLARAADAVVKGGVICYPTDTLYGLGCDPLNPFAVERTMKAKGDRTKAMPVLVKGMDEAGEIAYLSERARLLAAKFWPGPLTLVVHGRGLLPRILAPEGKIGLRSPNHPICRDLLGLCSGRLVGTSANRTGRPPATSAKMAFEELGDRVDIILDGDSSRLGLASTVVDLTGSKLVIVREGPVGREELFRCLRRR